MTCSELQRLVQELSTSCCFVSYFEISTGRTALTWRSRQSVGGVGAAHHRRRPAPRPAFTREWRSAWRYLRSRLKPLLRKIALPSPGTRRDPVRAWPRNPCRGRRRCARRTSGGEKKWRSRPISRVLSWTVIPLGAASPLRSSNLPGADRGPRHCAPYLVLLPVGFAVPVCCQTRGALLPHRFTLAMPILADSRSAVSFCCTFRRLAPPRRYLAPCPVEPGLSSACLRMTRLSGRLRRADCTERRATARVRRMRQQEPAAHAGAGHPTSPSRAAAASPPYSALRGAPVSSAASLAAVRRRQVLAQLGVQAPAFGDAAHRHPRRRPAPSPRTRPCAGSASAATRAVQLGQRAVQHGLEQLGQFARQHRRRGRRRRPRRMSASDSSMRCEDS